MSTSHSALAAASLIASIMRETRALGLLGVDRAGLGQQPRALGDDVGGADAAGDRADVRGRLGVDPALRHRGDGPRERQDRAAALLRADARVRGAAVELGPDAVVARRGGDHLADRGRVVEHVAELRAQLRRVEVRGAAQAVLLGDGEQQLDARRASLRRSRGGRPRASRRARPCCRRRGSRRARSPSRRRRRPARSARSARPCRGARTAAPSARERPGIRASRLPAPASAGPAASSSATSRPIARRRAVTSSAIARSSPNGLGIRQSSANVSLSRAFSASLAGRTLR